MSTGPTEQGSARGDDSLTERGGGGRARMAPSMDRLADLPVNVKDKIALDIFGCWIWTGAMSSLNTCPLGYGHLHRSVGGKSIEHYAHRWVFEFFRGPIGTGLTLDHLCRRTWCVNPRHLDPVTQRINALRGSGAFARNKRKTLCKRGHTLSPDPRNPGCRYCEICMRMHWANGNALAKQRRAAMAAQRAISKAAVR